mmetsp:Transcript_16393/g.66254  ORF Transcript_16393/g.66254 Transcript_16393/m.66254 type:complete len:266 (-) Transcript_16393:523-1320(-)
MVAALEGIGSEVDRGDESYDNCEDDGAVAKPGEQVAAKVTLIDENGSWILASIVSYNRRTTSYQVQDEDDATKIVELPASRIRRLHNESDDATRDLQKGDRVLAIFPETTSFYRAVISKSPKHNANGHIYEVVLKFEDDEDDAGRTPHRRVNIRYVLREHRPSSGVSHVPRGASHPDLINTDLPPSGMSTDVISRGHLPQIACGIHAGSIGHSNTSTHASNYSTGLSARDAKQKHTYYRQSNNSVSYELPAHRSQSTLECSHSYL